MQVLGDWKKRDEELDVKLGDLNILLDEIKMQVEQQGDVSAKEYAESVANESCCRDDQQRD